MRGRRLYPCSLCKKKLRSDIGVIAHQEVKHGEGFPTSCSICGKGFQLKSGALHHERTCSHPKIRTKKKSVRKPSGIYFCQVCNRGFDSAKALTQHKQNSGRHAGLEEVNKVNRYLNEELKSIAVEKPSRTKCRETINEILEPAMESLSRMDNRFTGNIRTSGSVATNTKIGKPDEFDYEVLMDPSMMYKLQLPGNYPNDDIPSGYAKIIGTNNQDINPHDVQQIIAEIMKSTTADMPDVDLSKKPHGPAITITIKKPGLHHISVDLTASMPIQINQINLGFYSWPRSQTRKVLPSMLIKDIIDAGLTLVPKKEQFWYISVSLAEKELMKKIDSTDDGCRKLCHKLLKRDFQKWNSQYSMPGISTMIFKHALFWMNEETKIGWEKTNIVVCYKSMLDFVTEKLENKFLRNYFKYGENILEGKQVSVLEKLARLCRERKNELSAM